MEYFFSYAWTKTVNNEVQTGFANSSLKAIEEFGINGIEDINYAEGLIAQDRGYDQVKILYWRKF